MTNMEKLGKMKNLIQPDEASDGLLLTLLEAAQEIVLSKRYPFGYAEGTAVPARYEMTQLRVAVELFSKMGAEGQVSHNENGISRSWEAGDVSPSLLQGILPVCGGVAQNANA